MFAEAVNSGLGELAGQFGVYPFLLWLVSRLEKIDKRVDRLEDHFGTKPPFPVRGQRKRFNVPLMFVCLACALAGCARFQSHQVGPDGTETTVTVWTLLQGKSEVAKLRTTQTDKSQGIGLGSLSQEANFTNTIHIVLPRP